MESFATVVSTILNRIRAHEASRAGASRPVVPSMSFGYTEHYRVEPATWELQGEAGANQPTAKAEGPSTERQECEPQGSVLLPQVFATPAPTPRGLLST